MYSVRIPGKVMLSGEYAVLHGATAVLVPLRRYFRLNRADEQVERVYPPVVRAALEIPIPAIAAHEAVTGVPHVEIDRSAFMGADAAGRSLKLGLGSSAAEAVGVIALRYECAGLPWIQHWHNVVYLAMQAHAQAQGAPGSGADIAACAYRRPLRFRRDGAAFSAEAIPRPPAEFAVPLTLAWTAQPADTRSLVRRFEEWRRESSGVSGDRLNLLRDSADELAQLWFSASFKELLPAIDDFDAHIRECCAMAGVAYLLPVHARLSAWAKRHGGRAKPTGAGGGDMVLLIGELPLEQLGDMLLIPLDYDEMWG